MAAWTHLVENCFGYGFGVCTRNICFLSWFVASIIRLDKSTLKLELSLLFMHFCVGIMMAYILSYGQSCIWPCILTPGIFFEHSWSLQEGFGTVSQCFIDGKKREKQN